MRYFAYCTLLDRDEMARFCPNAAPGDTGRVSGWRVEFAAYASERGGCHLVSEPGHDIHGIVYELSDEEMTGLDTISGVPQGFYERIDVDVTTEDGRVIPAITYIVPNPVGPFRPSETYVRPILHGARAVGLPAGYVAELEATVFAALSG
jgi:gamma-glutamylcyclotransferase (GGCT)/AIG2-like uncharacterized protein YtfP